MLVPGVNQLNKLLQSKTPDVSVISVRAQNISSGETFVTVYARLGESKVSTSLMFVGHRNMSDQMEDLASELYEKLKPRPILITGENSVPSLPYQYSSASTLVFLAGANPKDKLAVIPKN